MVALAISASALNQEGGTAAKQKWLVLDPITFGASVKNMAAAGGSSSLGANMFSGIDGLLLTKLADARKYRVVDRESSKTALREAGIGDTQVDLKGAGYSMRGEITDVKMTGAKQRRGQEMLTEYVVTVSLRVNHLSSGEAYIGKTVRIQEFCVSEKDLLIRVVEELAREVLFREYPIRIVSIDEDSGLVKLNYGEGFVATGEVYDACKVEEEEDPDTGVMEQVFSKKGTVQIGEVYERKSEGTVASGKVKKGYVLKRSKAAANVQKAVGVSPESAAPTIAGGAGATVGDGRYTCIVGNFGYAADFHAFRHTPDSGVLNKAIGGAFGILGGRTKRERRGAAIGGAINVLSDDSHTDEFGVRLTPAEWRSIAERSFAAFPQKFDMHAGIAPANALQDGIRYAVNGTVSQLMEKDGQCTVTFVLTMTDLQNNGSIVFSKDVQVTVPGAYAGQSTFSAAVSLAAGQFAQQLQ